MATKKIIEIETENSANSIIKLFVTQSGGVSIYADGDNDNEFSLHFDKEDWDDIVLFIKSQI